jgi:GST-like protein
MKLFRRAGWGSALVEYQLAWYRHPCELEDVEDLFQSEDARTAVRTFNPVAQIPTLVLDDGTVLTESAAITLWLAERIGSQELVPGPGDPERAAFLRWLVFLVANIYPCFTFADDPSRFVALAEAQKPFREAVNAHEKRLWETVEAAAQSPWFLGDRVSALDIYIAVMTRWRPGRAWFARETPRLHAIATAIEALPPLAEVIAANHDPLLD